MCVGTKSSQLIFCSQSFCSSILTLMVEGENKPRTSNVLAMSETRPYFVMFVFQVDLWHLAYSDALSHLLFYISEGSWSISISNEQVSLKWKQLQQLKQFCQTYCAGGEAYGRNFERCLQRTSLDLLLSGSLLWWTLHCCCIATCIHAEEMWLKQKQLQVCSVWVHNHCSGMTRLIGWVKVGIV